MNNCKRIMFIVLIIGLNLLWVSCKKIQDENIQDQNVQSEIKEQSENDNQAKDKPIQPSETENQEENIGFDWSALGRVKQVSAGNNYSLLLTDVGELYAWGSNKYYQLAQFGVDVQIPKTIMTEVIEISAGPAHAGAIKEDHTLWLWGKNDFHQVDLTDQSVQEPVNVMKDVQSFACGLEFTIVLKQDGTVWTFGRNNVGQLGTGTTVDSGVPIQILEDVIAVDAGSQYALALKSDGSLWGFGISNYGQLLGQTDLTVNSSPSSSTLIAIQSKPVMLLEDMKEMACGDSHAMAIDQAGQLFSWGVNTEGQLGNAGAGTWADLQFGGQVLFSAEPNVVLTEVIDIEGGVLNSTAIRKDGTLWIWGSNQWSQIGDGTSFEAAVPVQVLQDVNAVSMGYKHVMAIKGDGTYWAWGSNTNYVLGDGYSANIEKPIKIMDDVLTASIYHSHSLVVTKSQELYAFGENESGQLATGDFMNNSTPIRVMENVLDVGAGLQHSVCLKEDHTVWSWGSNTFGQIGNGQEDEVYSAFGVWQEGHPVWADAAGNATDTIQATAYKPTKILENASQVDAQWHTSYGILADDTLMGWGWNEMWQLGNESRDSSASPIAILGGVNNIVPNYGAIKKDNSLWIWGVNLLNPSSNEPYKALENVQSFALPGTANLAVKEDGTLWIWGQSIDGELVNIGSSYETVVEPIQIGEQVKKVFANHRNVYLIDKDAVLWGLESNDIKVEAISTEDSPVFTHIEEEKIMEDVADVFVGLNTVLVLKNDGSLWGFGDNEMGQLGNGKRWFVPRQIGQSK